MKPAFIIGNGRSRDTFDLKPLKQIGITFGCNALYRTFWPHFLVAIDDKIIAEIKGSAFPQERFIVPPAEEQFEPAECNRDEPRSNAGMNAMLEAIKRGHKMLYCLGFDFLLTHPDYVLSNVFEGTNAYEPDTRANIHDTIGRIRYLTYTARKNPDVAFWFIYPERALEQPVRTIEANNIMGMTYPKFLQVISEHKTV